MNENVGMASPEPHPDLLAEAWRLQALGAETMNLGKPAEGAALLRQGLELVGWREREPFHAHPTVRHVTARLLNSLAYAESEQGRHLYGLRLLDLAEPLAADEHRGLILQQRGVVTWKAGRLEESLAWYLQAEPLMERHAPMSMLAIMLLNRSGLQAEIGRFKAARADLKRCIDLAVQHGLPVRLAQAWHSQGNVELYSANIPAALIAYDKALRGYAEHAPDLVPQVLLNKAHALIEVGLFREAARLLDSVIGDYGKSGRTWWALAIVHIHRARIALDLDSPEAALATARRTEEVAHQIGSSFSILHAERLRRQSQLRFGEVSKDFVDQLLRLADQTAAVGVPDDAVLVRTIAARALIRQSRLDAATEMLREPVSRQGFDRQHLPTLRRLARAELAEAEGNPSGALTQLRLGLNDLHRHRSRLGSVEMQAGMSSLGRELAQMGLRLAVDSGRFGTVFSWAERSRAQTFRSTPVRPPENEEAAELLARVRKARDDIREGELAGDDVTDLRAQCRQWEHRLREHSWHSTGSGESVPVVRLGQVHERLASGGQMMVSYVTDRGRLHALVLRDGRNYRVELGGEPEVAEAVRRLHADLTVLTGRRLPEPMTKVVRGSIRNQADRLAELLFRPLLPLLGDRELVIVPTQAMSSLPWGLLPPLSGRPVTVSPSASVWWSAAGRVVARGVGVLLASGPDLVHAERELSEIAGHHTGAEVLQGSDATPAMVLAGLDGVGLAHLAAHGYHEPENVLFSRLDFAGGPLMAYDIAALSRPPAQVTLSACDVGQSTNVTAGEESLGFTAALLHAGTGTVVSSVTKVEHGAAADVMTAYHAGLVAGVSPARALADASLRRPLSPFVCYGAG
ncbi:CHAT domain-containing protein [Stackebrandtia albiflava]|nr:CHAT domain-containing tetratricopeptide repeat protein [Stackebrandtia albiflava]